MTSSALLALLDAEHAGFTGFIDILEREHRALRERDLDQLPELAQRKTDAARGLMQLAGRRHAWLTAQGASPDTAGMNAWLQRAVDAELSDAWQGLQTLARRAQSLNAVSGALLEARQSANREALAVLEMVIDPASTYGPDGMSRRAPGGRTLGEG
jgi:flagellar biosynthesis/type III secretory pathway chaperone